MNQVKVLDVRGDEVTIRVPLGAIEHRGGKMHISLPDRSQFNPEVRQAIHEHASKVAIEDTVCLSVRTKNVIGNCCRSDWPTISNVQEAFTIGLYEMRLKVPGFGAKSSGEMNAEFVRLGLKSHEQAEGEMYLNYDAMDGFREGQLRAQEVHSKISGS